MHLLTVLAAAAVASGCSSKSDKQEPKELVKSKDSASVDAPQDDLFDTGKRLYLKGLYSVSRDTFESLKNNYPMGPYAEFAEIKAADARLEMREYDTAAMLYENFAKDHPASRTIPYSLMMAGRCHQLAYGGLGRDTAPLEKSVQLYERLATAYPQSPYAASALSLKEETLSQLMAHQRFVADFYKRRNAEKAAAAREESYSKEWEPQLQQVKGQKEAMAAAVSAKPASGAPAVLVARRGGMTLEAPPAPRGAGGPAAPENAEALQLQSCRDNKITLTLGRERKLADLENQISSQRKLTPQNGSVTLKLGGEPSVAVAKDCFGSGDLRIAGDSITLRTTKPVTVMTMDRPARLIMLMD